MAKSKQADLFGRPCEPEPGPWPLVNEKKRRARREISRKHRGPVGSLHHRAACASCPDGIMRNAFTGAKCDRCGATSPDYSSGADFLARRGVWADFPAY